MKECGVKASDWNDVPIQYERQSSYVYGTPKAYEDFMNALNEYSNK